VEFEGAFVAHSLEEAIAMADDDAEVFIMGGAQIYAQALDIADRMYITRVERDYEGDTSFPEVDYSKWKLVTEERYERGEDYDSPFSLLTYDRK
jgi:dihydrofolate reductase